MKTKILKLEQLYKQASYKLNKSNQLERQEIARIALKLAGIEKSELHLVPYELIKQFRLSEKDI